MGKIWFKKVGEAMWEMWCLKELKGRIFGFSLLGDELVQWRERGSAKREKERHQMRIEKFFWNCVTEEMRTYTTFGNRGWEEKRKKIVLTWHFPLFGWHYRKENKRKGKERASMGPTFYHPPKLGRNEKKDK